MFEAAILALEVSSVTKIHMAFRSIAPIAPMTARQLIAFHAFSQMWSAMWGIPRPLKGNNTLGGQLPGNDVLMSGEDEDVR